MLCQYRFPVPPCRDEDQICPFLSFGGQPVPNKISTKVCALLTGMPEERPKSRAIPQAAVISRRLLTLPARTSGN